MTELPGDRLDGRPNRVDDVVPATLGALLSQETDRALQPTRHVDVVDAVRAVADADDLGPTRVVTIVQAERPVESTRPTTGSVE